MTCGRWSVAALPTSPDFQIALPGSGTTQVELTAAADDAVYRSKRAGKNRVSLADTQEGEDGQAAGSYQ